MSSFPVNLATRFISIRIDKNRCAGVMLVSFLMLLAWTPFGLSGIYGGTKPVPGPTIQNGTVKPLSFGEFRLYFTQYTVDLIKATTPLYKTYVADRDKLQAAARRGPLKTADALDLSVLFMRLREDDQAVQLLTPIVLRERNNFMLMGNLASAYQASGRLDRALEYLQQVQDVWPREWPGFDKAKLDWYHELEKYQLRLVKKRYRESLQRSVKAKETLDDLFEGPSGPVQYKADDGTYQAGKMAEAERKKLPPNALAIVQQLVLWFPDDTRLYWQLGELYNAQGDIAAAATIFHECIWTRRYGASALQEHRKIVEAAAPKQTAPVLEDEPVKAQPTPQPDPAAWLPERRQIILVAGVAGIIACVLIFLQIREFRQRRRQHRK